MIEFESDIPSLSEEGIEMRYEGFENVNVLISASMIGWLLMNEMLIHLIELFESGWLSMKEVMEMIVSNEYRGY